MGSSDSPQINKVQNSAVQGLSGNILSKATENLNSGFGAVPQQQAVGFNPYQQSVMAQLQQVLGTANPLTSQATNYVGDVLNGKYLDPSTNPALAASGAAISSGAQKFLNQNLDQLGSNFALAGGASSSALANAKKSAVTSTAGQVGQSLAQLYGNAYGNERAAQSGVLGQAQALANDPMSRLMAALGLGSQQQAMAQAQADMPLQNYLTGRSVQQNSLQSALAALSGVNDTFYQPTFAPSELAQNMGMVFQGMNATGNLLGGASKAYAACDRRLKEGIVKLGERLGLGIYAFRYKAGFGLPVGERIGMMADEVREMVPAAVRAFNDFLHVDYDLVFAGAC